MTSGPEASAFPVALPPDGGWQDDPQRRVAHSMQRLQPVVLGPPPDPSFRDASAADDLDPSIFQPRRRPGLLVGVVALVLVLLTAGSAYVWMRGQDTDLASRLPVPPPIVVPPAESPQVANPTLVVPPAPVATVPQPAPADTPTSERKPVVAAPLVPPEPQPPSENPEMGGVQTELVPPATEGLSPARRVQTIRIIVENDRELTVPR